LHDDAFSAIDVVTMSEISGARTTTAQLLLLLLSSGGETPLDAGMSESASTY
jgi:hypothetical protein